MTGRLKAAKLCVLLGIVGLSFRQEIRAGSFSFTTFSVLGTGGARGRDINDSGEIVGTLGGFPVYAATGTPDHLARIDLPGNPYISIASGINNAGDIVGGYATTPNADYHAFLDRRGVLTTFDAPGATTTFASGINNRGDIVGFINVGTQGFLLSGGRFKAIQVPGADLTYPEAINNTGRISGWYVTNDGDHIFTEINGSYTTLLIPGSFGVNWDPGLVVEQASGVNDRGEIVGFYDGPLGAHGFVYSDGVFSTLDVPGAIATFAEGINNKGQIVGRFYDPYGEETGFIATPIPEPGLQSLFWLFFAVCIASSQLRDIATRLRITACLRY